MVEYPGWLIRFLVGWLLASVRFDRRHVDTIRDAQQRGAVVLVMRSRSLVDYLYFNVAFLQRGLRLVRFANGIRTWFMRSALAGLASLLMGKRGLPDDQDSVEQLVEASETILLFLHTPAEQGNAFGLPLLERLVTAARRSTAPVILVPQLLLWDKRPDAEQPTLLDSVFGTRQSPGFFRSIVYVIQNVWQSFLNLGEPSTQVSSPFELNDFLLQYSDRTDQQIAHLLYDHLLGILDREQRVVVGPGIKAAPVLRDEILADARTRSGLQAAAPGMERNTQIQKARKILKEIAADFDLLGIKVLSAILTPIWNQIYDGIELDTEGLERVRNTMREKRLIIVPSHKSHIDYLLISYLFYRNGLIPPHIAAGVNLSFWPMGPIFRRCGAFFLRRTFAGDPLYPVLFNAYLVKLLEEGFSIEFFIEGTRSRTGKLNTPKYGMLNMIVDAFRSGEVEQMAFVPVSVGYESIIEGSSYRHELEGGEKEGESLGGLIRSSSFLAKRYGRVYVEFGDPIDLGQFMTEYHGTAKPEIERTDLERSVRRLAYRIIHGINDVTSVTPSGIAALLLLNSPESALDRSTMAREAGFVVGFLRERHAHLSATLTEQLLAQLPRIHRVQHSTPDLASFNDFDQEYLTTGQYENADDTSGASVADEALGEAVVDTLDAALRLLADKQLVQFKGEGKARIWTVADEKRIELDFYKNNIIHYFVPEAVFATAMHVTAGERKPVEHVKTYARFLSRLFKYEFCFEERSRFDDVFNRSFDYFLARNWISSDDDRSFIELVEPNADGPEFLRGLMLPALEAYRVAALTLPELGDEAADAKALGKKAIAKGRSLRASNELIHPEAVSRATFENAFKVFREWGVLIESSQDGGRKKVRLLSVAPERRGPLLQEFIAELSALVNRQERTPGSFLRTV